MRSIALHHDHHHHDSLHDRAMGLLAVSAFSAAVWALLAIAAA